LYSDITFEKVKGVIDQAADAGVFLVGLTGGECTLHPDFLKIATYVRQKKLKLFAE
jgi:MoaA/NifB/PqqE/SkfB family radical SAM enzyme